VQKQKESTVGLKFERLPVLQWCTLHPVGSLCQIHICHCPLAEKQQISKVVTQQVIYWIGWC